MSIYAVINESEPVFFASNSGWTDVCEWSDTTGGDSELVDLCNEGYTENVKDCLADLQVAVKKTPPPNSVQATLEELTALMDGEEGVLIITNGMEEETTERDKNGIRML